MLAGRGQAVLGEDKPSPLQCYAQSQKVKRGWVRTSRPGRGQAVAPTMLRTESNGQAWLGEDKPSWARTSRRPYNATQRWLTNMSGFVGSGRSAYINF